jgi:hypothetical protein|nr:O-antigen ligase family protein [uncultured Acetatifactor sp.]
MKPKIKPKNWMIYFILIPFLHPRGFDEYFYIYKFFFTSWLYLSLIIIAGLFLYGLSKKRAKVDIFASLILLYYLTMAVITFTIRHTFSGGLQKIFAAPLLCIFCIYSCKRFPKRFIECVNNLLFIILFLNAVIFSPLFWKAYFAPISNHLTFLGHVQINAQLATVSILMAYVGYSLFDCNKKKFMVQVILAFMTLMTSFTSASYIVILLLSFCWFLYRVEKINKLFEFDGKTFVLIYIAINLFLFWFIANIDVAINIGAFSLNGRGFIWKEAISSFFRHPFSGYGVQGVLIKVFWSFWVGDGQGMNYMHNQLLQVLNDGGIILCVFFLMMLMAAASGISKLKKTRLRYWVSVFLMILLIIMIFESALDYFYGYIILSTIANLPGIASAVNVRKGGNIWVS